MARYGADIRALGRRFVGRFPASDDPTRDALVYLALAYTAIDGLRERAESVLELQNRLLILPSIERAYRETLHVRSQLPPVWLDTTEISRFGRLYASDLSHPPE
jgi:hypothetical protein